MNQTTDVGARKPLRLWPGVALVVAQWLLWFGLPVVAPDAGVYGLMGGMVAALLIIVWWVLFSRAPWTERIGAIVLMVAAVVAVKSFVHVSIDGAGQGQLMYVYSVPGLCLALVAWALIAGHRPAMPRRAALVAAVALVCGPWLLLRTAGVGGGAGSEFHWRWTPTPEERLLAQGNDDPPAVAPGPVDPLPRTPATAHVAPTAAPAVDAPGTPTEAKAPTAGATAVKTAAPLEGRSGEDAASDPVVARAEWPGFRGPNRDGVVHGVTIETDWSASPPKEMWRRPIGPGWSSFAVQGDLLYTQEQRGDDEIVGCYRVATGEPVWRHRDQARFWESNGGAGPRGTPTIDNGRIYAFGATGILNALNAKTGAVYWSRNVAADTKRRVPDWGFASSPLVVDDLVVVAAAGTLAAYDRATGHPRWTGPSYGGSYSSPHHAVIGGIEQILLLGGPGAISVAPSDGAVLWKHEWQPGPIVQPAILPNGDVLINTIAMTGGQGTRRLAIAHGASGWTAEERWTSNGLKPYFNDFVVHKNFAFGFDGSILAAIDLDDGKRAWKGGRYGNGQLVLLPDQDLLLVLSEDGELVLVSATTDQFKELARVPALNGKTWNHPVLVGDVLLVRNGEEMAAFRLSADGR
jgi:outer membrane protein assembly factor BamB